MGKYKLKHDPWGHCAARLDYLVSEGFLLEKAAKQEVKRANKQGIAGTMKLLLKLNALHYVYASPERQMDLAKYYGFTTEQQHKFAELRHLPPTQLLDLLDGSFEALFVQAPPPDN